MKKQETKSITWRMRASKKDIRNIEKLSRQLGIKSTSEAVRRAVAHMMELTEKPTMGNAVRQ